MNDSQMMQGAASHMPIMWIIATAFAGLLLVLIVLGLHLARRPKAAGVALPELPAARRLGRTVARSTRTGPAEDLVFFLPDISNYTRFMTGSRFSFDHAMTIVLALVDAMIEEATKTLEFSKLEGDAALFFVEADRHAPELLGETAIAILSAFYRERAALKASNICPCRACTHMDDLDIKIFVHRGEAARFRFNDSTDLFGTDVIVLHRMMKNSVGSPRYIMVTEAAAGRIALPDGLAARAVEEQVEHIGAVRGQVFEFGSELITAWTRTGTPPRRSVLSDTLTKLRGNLRLETD
ncbi:DUF2652 domain-containing protein [Nisaea sp.]|uniref:DUF2652 domain-containing protein n=1 Tax=Nisaea sp. TaxID=2024842 RepID=UPI003B51615E